MQETTIYTLGTQTTVLGASFYEFNTQRFEPLNARNWNPVETTNRPMDSIKSQITTHRERVCHYHTAHGQDLYFVVSPEVRMLFQWDEDMASKEAHIEVLRRQLGQRERELMETSEVLKVTSAQLENVESLLREFNEQPWWVRIANFFHQGFKF